MPRYKLRTLLILLAVLPPVLAGAWWGYGKWREEQRRLEELHRIEVDHDHGGPWSPTIEP
jgi:hypothetical protein